LHEEEEDGDMRIPPQFGDSHHRGHHRSPMDDMAFYLEDWDFQNVPREDAKMMAKGFVGMMCVGIFAYVTFCYAIFGAIWACILNRSQKIVERHE
jgi:hypothetical protein